ncbi:MAG: sigma-70 family RNA polymerase sigma factor [Acidobacteriota bacterium]
MPDVQLAAPDEPTDAELIERASAGDEQAFASIVRRHQGLVLSIAYRFLGEKSLAEDVAQEVFLRLWRSARKYRPDTALGAYVRKIAVNYCLDLKRKEKIHVPAPDDRWPSAWDARSEMEATERRKAIEAAIQALPASQRMAVGLFHMEGLAVKEVADLLETSPKAVESLLSRARTNLRARLSAVLR